MSNLFLIKNNNNILGIYDDFKLTIDFIYSNVQLNFIKKNENILIIVYKKNTSIILKEIKVNLNSNIIVKSYYDYINNFCEEEKLNIITKIQDIESDSDNETSVSSTNSKYEKNKIIQKETDDLSQQKIDIIHNINILKKEKEQIENDINVYNNDIILYTKFKNNLNEDNKFIIPFLFEIKFKIFKHLEENNKLDFDNFKLLYINDSLNSYDDIFNNNTKYENKFINNEFNSVSTEELFNIINM